MREMPEAGPIRQRLERWRIVSPTGAQVVSLRRLDPKDRFKAVLPSLFTTANMVCGFSAVLLAFRQEFRFAATLLAVAILMDILDGFVARLVGATTPFGVQLDSMADLISFGVAPAVLVHTWGLAEWPALSWIFAFFWVGCAAFRLARFNVTVDPLADKRYFIGLPSPGAAGVPIATIFAMESPKVGPWLLMPLAVSVLPALLMVTTARFKSFRSVLALHHGPKWVLAVVVLALVLGLALRPGLTGLVIAYGYVLTAPLGWLTAVPRTRLFGPDSVAPRRYKLPSVFLTGDIPGDEGVDLDDDDEPGPMGAPGIGLGSPSWIIPGRITYHGCVLNAAARVRPGHDLHESRTRDRVVREIGEHGPISAADLGTRLGLTPTAVRRHLDLLSGEGAIVEHERPPTGRRGRPARAWVLSATGHESLDADYDELAEQAVRYIAEIGGEAGVAAFARARLATMETRYAAELDGVEGPAARATALAAVLNADGFAASARPMAEGGASGVQICQGHCPVQQVATEFPEFCEAEAQAFSRLVGAHVQRLATLAHGDHVCTTFIPLPSIPTKEGSDR